ncbi:BRO family protein [Providencia rettgeri]|uniref:BRO family protein n=2 Tax=Morganellaceae TaxID=1903414 RepID=UPI001B36C99E|nr:MULTISPECIES: BRO family protein [Providencia]MBQ0530454.1 DNA replication protein DnaD [Providencia rettgeri]WOB85013.1 DNA replication protein DnaD [Providencia sp. PROV040]
MSKFGCDMSEQLSVFSGTSEITFDDFAQQNGITYWLASDLAMMLGYTGMDQIHKAINKATAVCINLNIPVFENFIQTPSKNSQNDFKLTRFACYLTVMNGDISNTKVANAQAYFAQLAVEIEAACQDYNSVNRVYLRGEITSREKSLGHVAKAHGVVDYALFQNAGYRGMYNMNLSQLKARKGMGGIKDTILDYMDSEELAANIFRITQTEARIRNQNLKGQGQLEDAAHTVGRSVRQVMIANTGTAPESIPLSQEKINKVKSSIKKTRKALEKHDKPKNK